VATIQVALKKCRTNSSILIGSGPATSTVSFNGSAICEIRQGRSDVIRDFASRDNPVAAQQMGEEVVALARIWHGARGTPDF
jgi:hypothetical protein